jgi:hypothetical protein
MNQLLKVDLDRVVRNIPADVRQLIGAHGLILAGGFIREHIAGRNDVRDLDLFGASKERLKVAASMLHIKRGVDTTRLHESDFAYTVLSTARVPVQFIHNWTYTEPQALLDELDFTVCQAAIWKAPGGEWQSLCSERFYPDLAARRLVYTMPSREELAGGSIMRVRKMLARGYSIQADSFAGVIARLVGGIDERKLGGLIRDGRTEEQARHLVLKSLLHEVDPLLLVDGLEMAEEGAEE